MNNSCKFFYTLVFLLFSAPFFSGCIKSVPAGKLETGEIALTFDDSSVDNWYSYLPLLDSLHMKVTFYVCKYHSLTPEQKSKLKMIATHGHEIAYHTTNHPDLVKMLRKSGLYPIMSTEIQKDLTLMQQDGFVINNFAYPYGSHVPELDVALLRTFKSIRAVSNQQNWNTSLIKQSGDQQLLHGAGIDENSKLKEEGIIDLLQDAQTSHDCVVLVAHEINRQAARYHVSTERLRMIAQEAQHRNLKFVTINEVIHQ